MSAADTTATPTQDDGPRVHDQYVWTQPDGAVIYVRVTRVSHTRGWAWLRCHYDGRSWTSRQPLPLRPSIVKREWTTAELLDTIT